GHVADNAPAPARDHQEVIEEVDLYHFVIIFGHGSLCGILDHEKYRGDLPGDKEGVAEDLPVIAVRLARHPDAVPRHEIIDILFVLDLAGGLDHLGAAAVGVPA